MNRFKVIQVLAVLSCAIVLFKAGMAHAEARKFILLADAVYLQGDSILTAEGNIDAVSGDITLTAEKIVYNSVLDKIEITGPIHVSDGATSEIFAEFAELDTSLQFGLLSSARLVLNQQVELRADQINRRDGGISELHKVEVTSCKTCEDGKAPVWHIRAKKVTHNTDKKQLLLHEAQLRVFDVPVFYIPRLRLPDPTQDRATGFLIPSFHQRSRIGLAAKTPYFIKWGDHKDITVTPFLSRNMTTLEARYRQAFRLGTIELEGAVTKDDFSGFDTRAYLFAQGKFELDRDFDLSFDAKFTSDEAYLLDYDYSDLDRLNSELALTRSGRDEDTKIAFNHFRSLRASEDNATLPSVVLSARSERRFFPHAIGGEGRWELELHSHLRESQVATDANLDNIVDGRDVTRFNAELGWQDDWWTAAGLNIGVTSQLAFDAVFTDEDATIAQERYAQLTPSFGVFARYPMVRETANGAQQMFEPVLQVAWSGGAARSGTGGNTIANDESTRSEFDEGNLLSLSRFSSDDRRERGLSVAYGANWTQDYENWTAALSVGQVFHSTAQSDFTPSSGLGGTLSDVLVAGQFAHENGLNVMGRALFDENITLNKAELSGGWHKDRIGLDAAYVWLGQDPAENRTSILAEWTLDARYRMTKHWTGLANWRYDIADQRTSVAGFGVEYQNECVNAQIAVSRRFTSSTSVKPATDISFTVELLGFSAKTRDKSYSRSCQTSAY